MPQNNNVQIVQAAACTLLQAVSRKCDVDLTSLSILAMIGAADQMECIQICKVPSMEQSQAKVCAATLTWDVERRRLLA